MSHSAIEKRKRTKKYMEIVEAIEQRISEGIFDCKIPRNKLIADFKVNKNTVDKAINVLVNRGILTRYSGYGTYISGKEPASININTRNINTRKYAMLVNQRHDPLFLDIFDTCDEEIAKIGGSLIYIKFDKASNYKRLIGRFRVLRVEGIFIVGWVPPALVKLLEKEFNIILVDSGLECESVNSVSWDNFLIGYDIAQGLISQGVSSFTFVGHSMEKDYFDSLNLKQRFEGFKAAVEESAFPYSLHIIEKYDYSALTPHCDLAKSLKENDPASHSLVVIPPKYIFMILSKTECWSLLPDLRSGSLLINDENMELYPHGTYAVFDTKKMAKIATEILLDIIGRPRSKPRKEILKAEVRLVN